MLASALKVPSLLSLRSGLTLTWQLLLPQLALVLTGCIGFLYFETLGARLSITLGLIGLAVLVTAFMVQRITEPLTEIKLGAERFARGDLSFRLYAANRNEIGALARALNKVAAQLEERLRTVVHQRNELDSVLSTMLEGVLVVDHHERVVHLNRAARDLLLVEMQDFAGKPLLEVVRNFTLLSLVRDALRSGTATVSELATSESEPRSIQAYSKAMHYDEGRPPGVLIVLNDITRIRRLENMRKDFVANVSHELKTPITSIKGSVETLLDGALESPDDARRFLEIVARQVDRLHAIFEDLLMLSRLEDEATAQQLELTTGPVLPILLAAQETCSFKAHARRISLKIDCSKDLAAHTIPSLLEQAIVNLVDNAVKYSPDDSVVEIRAAERDGRIAIQVEDHGPGIERTHLPRLFERFYRVDQARSRKLGGTGLGLAIVKHIAQAHGGTVSAESVVGQGSVFTLVVPAAPAVVRDSGEAGV